MKQKRALGLFIVALVLGTGAPCTRAWGCKGHQTIALIAEKHLTPEARELVEKLLSENPIDPQLNGIAGSSREICWQTVPPGPMTRAGN